MKRTYVRLAVPVILLFVIVTTAYAGGWAVITVRNVLDYAVAGKPIALTFSVRQHGVTLLDDLKPSVRATTAGGLKTKAAATSTGHKGEYTASLVLPEAGEWTIRIDSGFLSNVTTLPALKVIQPGSPAPLAFTPVTRGEHLFVAKGCTVCHRGSEGGAGPDLTAKRFSPDYLKGFLADPKGEMPNLHLKEEEIAALIAFISR